MQAELLNVGEHEEGILQLSFLNHLLQSLVLQDVAVYGKLNLSQGQPHDQVCLQRQLGRLEISVAQLSRPDDKDLVFGSPQEVRLVHLSQLAGESIGNLHFFDSCIFKEAFLYFLGVFSTEAMVRAKNLWLDEIKDSPQLIQVVL